MTSVEQDKIDSLDKEVQQVLGAMEPSTRPYMNYIRNRRIANASLSQYLELFIYIVRYFQNTGNSTSSKNIRILVNELNGHPHVSFLHPRYGGRRLMTREIEDAVLYIIGTWTMLRSSFIRMPAAGGARRIAIAYAVHAQESQTKRHPYQEDVAGLLTGSGLLPVEDQDLQSRTDSIDEKLMQAIHFLNASEVDAHEASVMGQVGRRVSPTRSERISSLRFLEELESMESQHITATHLNAYTLNTFGAVNIMWTPNISRHMLLSKTRGRHVLEIFAMPCALNVTSLTSDVVGVSSAYAQEITESYSILFNAWARTPRHVHLGKTIGIRKICWCRHCSSYRFRKQGITSYHRFCQVQLDSRAKSRDKQFSEFDPLLLSLMSKRPSDWTPDMFPTLWSRILALEQHLSGAKPWSIWVLFRDRRDTLQFWTFLFGTIVVLLTFVQMVLGIAQVVGSFR